MSCRPLWWRGEDLNLRRLTPADLQSAPFGHLGTPPILVWSWRWDSNPQPADYKSAALPIELRQRKEEYLSHFFPERNPLSGCFL